MESLRELESRLQRALRAGVHEERGNQGADGCSHRIDEEQPARYLNHALVGRIVVGVGDEQGIERHHERAVQHGGAEGHPRFRHLDEGDGKSGRHRAQRRHRDHDAPVDKVGDVAERPLREGAAEHEGGHEDGDV